MRVTTGESRTFALALIGVAAALLAETGCSRCRYVNTVPHVDRHIRASRDGVAMVMFKASILVPARDILTLDPPRRALFGGEAWNLDGDAVHDSSFYTNRDPRELTPARLARGANTMPPPQPPFRIEKLRLFGGGNLGFIGTDALERTFLFKLDHPDHPELGTTATIVGSRILWALGYNVPPSCLVQIAGTGDKRFDGRRASATLFLDGVIGHFHFDWFRHRRELRGLRLACAWINDTDRIGSNTLVVERDGRATYYLIDFDSCLGSWQGRPKEPWRGHRHAWDLLPLPPNPTPPASPTLGRLAAEFEPRRWRAQAPNNAFNHMTDADATWMIERIRHLGRPQLEAIVGTAQMADPRDADRLVEVLLARRAAILESAR